MASQYNLGHLHETLTNSVTESYPVTTIATTPATPAQIPPLLISKYHQVFRSMCLSNSQDISIPWQDGFPILKVFMTRE